jgi:hypothetical protein
VLLKRANREHWKDDREKASNKAAIRAQQKAADLAADNATIAERLKRKMLLRLEREFDALPELIGTETRQNMQEREYDGDKGRLRKLKDATKAYKLRDFTAAYKDLTGDMPTGAAPNELLQSLVDLERGAR